MSGRAVRASLLTPRGAGGVAVVRVEGPDLALWLHAVAGCVPMPGMPPRLRRLQVGDVTIDEALLAVVDDAVELHLHGSEAVLAAVEASLAAPLQSAVDPLAALLARAASEAQLDLALEQAELLRASGGFAGFLASASRAQLQRACAGAEFLRAVFEPQPLVLCGRKNAGKSTLMNRLLARERVLTGPQPGLTRDPVRDAVVLDGYPYDLIDTAGEGDVRDELDAAAIARGRQVRAGALTLRVVDGSLPLAGDDIDLLGDATLVLRNKADLPQVPWPPGVRRPDLSFTALDPAAAFSLRTELGRLLREFRRLPPPGPLRSVVPLDAEQARQLAVRLQSLPET